jgi:hypothetical protein
MPRESDLSEREFNRSLSLYYIENSGPYYTISELISAEIFSKKDPLI